MSEKVRKDLSTPVGAFRVVQVRKRHLCQQGLWAQVAITSLLSLSPTPAFTYCALFCWAESLNHISQVPLSTTFLLGFANRRHWQEVKGWKKEERLQLMDLTVWPLPLVAGGCCCDSRDGVILKCSSLCKGNTLSGAVSLVNAPPFQHTQIELPHVSYRAAEDAASGFHSRTLTTSSFSLFQVPSSILLDLPACPKFITNSLHLIPFEITRMISFSLTKLRLKGCRN